MAKLLDVGLGLGRIERLAHDLEAGVGAIGHGLAQGLHLLLGVGQQKDLFGQLLVVDLALDVPRKEGVRSSNP